jgi:hypothetical protein
MIVAHEFFLLGTNNLNKKLSDRENINVTQGRMGGRRIHFIYFNRFCLIDGDSCDISGLKQLL